jgi:hypothetical protein
MTGLRAPARLLHADPVLNARDGKTRKDAWKQ